MTVRRVVTIVAVCLLALASTARAATPGSVSFTQAQQQFMCTICHEPLNEANSPEAYQENTYLRQLIAHGDSLAQIRHEMVVQYGSGVLADPPKHGFAILVVVVPVAVIVLGVLTLAFTVPRWRRRAAKQSDRQPPGTGPPVDEADAQRLEAELARER